MDWTCTSRTYIVVSMTDTFPGDRSVEAAGAAINATTVTSTEELAELVQAPLRPIQEVAAAVGALPLAESIKGSNNGANGAEGGDRPGVSAPDADGMVTVTTHCRTGVEVDDDSTSDGQCAVVVGEPEKKEGGLGTTPCLVYTEGEPEAESPDGINKTEEPARRDHPMPPDEAGYVADDADTPPPIEVNAPYSDGTVAAIESLIKTF
jgi:hypothetical protein